MTRLLAPYHGTCYECGWPIVPGDEIDADDDSPAAHGTCVDAAAETHSDEEWWEQ